MKHIFFFAAMPLALATACGGGETGTTTPPAQEKFTIRCTGKAGDANTMHMKWMETMSQPDDHGKDVVITNSDMTMVLKETVTAAEADGSLKMESVYESFDVKMEMAGQKMEYNSANPPGDPMQEMFHGLVGKKATYTSSPDGKISGLSSEASPMYDPMFVSTDGYNYNQNLTETIDMMNPYPGKEVAVGDTWVETRSQRAMYAMTVVDTFKLISADEHKFVIESSGIVKPCENGVFSLEGGSPMKSEFNGTRKGNYEIDRKTGQITSTKIAMDMKGDMVSKNEKGEESRKPTSLLLTVDITYTPSAAH